MHTLCPSMCLSLLLSLCNPCVYVFIFMCCPLSSSNYIPSFFLSLSHSLVPTLSLLWQPCQQHQDACKEMVDLFDIIGDLVTCREACCMQTRKLMTSNDSPGRWCLWRTPSPHVLWKSPLNSQDFAAMLQGLSTILMELVPSISSCFWAVDAKLHCSHHIGAPSCHMQGYHTETQRPPSDVFTLTKGQEGVGNWKEKRQGKSLENEQSWCGSRQSSDYCLLGWPSNHKRSEITILPVQSLAREMWERQCIFPVMPAHCQGVQSASDQGHRSWLVASRIFRTRAFKEGV